MGGYSAVHSRPPAFEGIDGFSYSADIVVDETGDVERPLGAYLLFVKWGHGEPEVKGHLESDFLIKGKSEGLVKHELSRMKLATVKATLDGLIRAKTTDVGARPWWEAMNDSSDDRTEHE